MRLLTLLTTLALASPLLADPVSIITNKCPFPLYLTSIAVARRNTTQIPSHGTYTEGLYLAHNAQGNPIGTSLQLTRDLHGLDQGKPILNLGYTYHAGQDLYFDLGTVYGFDLWGATIFAYAGAEPGLRITWAGEPKPQDTKAYLKGDTDLVLEICA